MTEQPGSYIDQPPPTIGELKRDCHRLIEQVAQRPGAIKLLLGIRDQAMIFSQYKANRDYRRAKNADRG
jgi:hypothetical protein